MGLQERFDSTETHAPLRTIANLHIGKFWDTFVNASSVAPMAIVLHGHRSSGRYVVIANRNATQQFVIPVHSLEPFAARPKGTLQADAPFEKLLSEVERLKDHWAGPDSVAPPKEVVRDLRAFLSQLEPKTRVPEVDVDTDDGSVTLRWPVGNSVFSCVLSGKGAVTGVFSSLKDQRPASWRCKVDENALRRVLESPEVRAFIEA
jgi:hypothetical protein